MLNCPACESVLDEEFGIVTCKNCQAVLMIDISGEVRVGGSESPLPEDDDVTEPESPEFDGFNMGDDVLDDQDSLETRGFGDNAEVDHENSRADDYSFEGAEDDNQFSGDTNQFESMGSDAYEDVDQDSFSKNYSSDSEDEVTFDNDFESELSSNEPESFDAIEYSDEMSGSSEVLTGGESETGGASEDFTMPNEPDSEPVDITEFANSEESSLEEGELLYDITISRLDSRDLKESLKYVLMDEKLKLDHGAIVKSIADGRVTIHSLNPIKAKRIVEQLQYQDIDIRWKQKRVVMEVVDGEPVDDAGEELDGVGL